GMSFFKRNTMQNLKQLILAGGLTAILALTGCKTSTSQSGSQRMAGQKLDDNRITENVKNDLSREPVYKFNDVNVMTYKGVVQLSGFVQSDQQRQRAGQIAMREQGVAQVVNNISLKPSSNLAPTSR